MKTNVSIELTDSQRGYVAWLLDGKTSKRLATRKEVTQITQDFWQGLIDGMNDWQRPAWTSHGHRHPAPGPAQPDNESYMRGWNLVGERL